MSSNIEAPDSVSEGTTGTIQVDAPTSTSILVTFSASGTTVQVNVVGGVARFELPAGVSAGSTVLITDSSDFSNSDVIVVVPASN